MGLWLQHLVSLAALLPQTPRFLPHATRASFQPRMSTSWSPDDDESLLRAISSSSSSTKLGTAHSVLEGIDRAWVLIFNAGKQDEGVYTLQGRATPASAYVLAFERTDDADRFAYLLQAEGFDLATPMCWDTDQLATFCSAGSFEVSLVPQDTLITPPRKNEYDVDAFHKLDEPADPYADGLNARYGYTERDGADHNLDSKGLDSYPDERDRFERLFRK
jgi:hypothetical protein